MVDIADLMSLPILPMRGKKRENFLLNLGVINQFIFSLMYEVRTYDRKQLRFARLVFPPRLPRKCQFYF